MKNDDIIGGPIPCYRCGQVMNFNHPTEHDCRKLDPDRLVGLYRKYKVIRLDDTEGKHANDSYFVLNLDRDRFAIPALRAYAVACAKEYPQLAEDLWNICREHNDLE